MLRTALRPRWLALLALVLVAASGMARLGQWQLDRARENGGSQQQQELRRPAVPLGSVLTARHTFPGTAVDRPVTASGTWDGAHQVLVAGRSDGTASGAGSSAGFWVLTPLLLADGSAVPVVRGWVPTVSDPAAAAAVVPAGTVRVTGVLEPSEPPDDAHAPGWSSGLPPGQIDLVDVTQLIKVWPYPLLTGYVVLTAQTPPGGIGHLVQVRPASSGLALRNLSYALQWFLFAAFGLFVWWRLVREDHRGTLGHPGREAPGAVGDDGAPTTAVGGSRT